jgi:regulator of protease activity HflC (stomatin/prohibitin superfamily)
LTAWRAASTLARKKAWRAEGGVEGLGVLVALVVIAGFLFSSAVRVVQEYERGVIFRLGRLVGARGPGLFLLIPWAERMVKVDLRVVTHDIPGQ